MEQQHKAEKTWTGVCQSRGGIFRFSCVLVTDSKQENAKQHNAMCLLQGSTVYMSGRGW